MCYAVTCKTCGKTTWAGCGQHIDSVRQQVPASQWCGGHASESGKSQGSFFSRLIGR